MRLVRVATLVAALVLSAAPAFGQERTETPPPSGPGRGEAPPTPPAGPAGEAQPSPPPAGTGREGQPATPPTGPAREGQPAPPPPPTGRSETTTETPTGRTESPEDARFSELERRVAEQQREIDALKREREAKDLKGGPDEKGAAHEAGETAPQFEWGFQDGFFVKGVINDQPYELRPTVRLQLDYRAYPHDKTNDLYQNKPPSDEFLVRRARIGFTGRFGVFAFDLECDPARNTTTQLLLGDFWFQYQQFPEFCIRLGHFKAPFAVEDGMTSDNYTDFTERAIITGSGNQLAPDFHVGAMVFGTFGDARFGHGIFQYYLAAQNQKKNNAVGSGDPMTTARLASEVGPLIVGASGRWERRSGIPGTGATASVTELSFTGATPGQYNFFTPVLVRGWTQAYEIDLSVYQGPFWMRGEFGYGSQERWRVLADHTNGTALVTQGMELTGGWLFWAPSKSASHPLFPFKDWSLFNMDAEKSRTRNVGAEVVTTLQWLSIDDARGGRKAAPSTAPNAANVNGNECKTVGLGFNLYPIENVKLMADYFALRIGDEARAETAHSRFANEIMLRAQIEF